MIRNFATQCLLFFVLCGSVQAQFPPLRFVFEPGPDPHLARYGWRTFISQDDFLSPGGTLITNSFQQAEFETFEEFSEDVIGMWTVTNAVGQTGTFEILSLQETDFEPLELVSPASGTNLFSGQTFDIIVSPNDPDETGVSFVSPTPDVECQCLGTSGRIVLPIGVDQATGRLSGLDTEDREDLVTGSQGDVIVSDLTLVTLTVRAELSIVAIVQGDTNLDGLVDLLDVAPFIDLLTSGGFLPQADVNQDGAVDLLDVVPFVELLLG